MVEFGRYLILENTKEFASRWNEQWHTWDYSSMDRPVSYPCAFSWQESPYPRSRGSWRSISMQEAKEAIKNSVQEKIKEFQETLDMLDKL